MDTIKLLHNIMNGCAARHRVLSDNLANADTPQFKRQDVDFRKTLEEAINTRDINKLKSVQFDVETDYKSPVSSNGNNVSTQRELGLILENSLIYNTSAQALSSKLARMKKAIGSR